MLTLFFLLHINFSTAQENQYTFSHYYGNSIRREDDNHAHRDFAQDGGFLCPSGKFFPLHLQIDINFETTFMAFIPLPKQLHINLFDKWIHFIWQVTLVMMQP